MSDHDQPHLPSPTLWPIGFAVGIACILAGLVLSWVVAVVGVAIAVFFGFLWIRDVTKPVRATAPAVEPEARPPRTTSPVTVEDEPDAYSRSTFLSAATLGLGGVIGGVITVPVLGFAVLPSFTNQHDQEVDLGPIENFPENEFVIATYLEDPEVGEVTRRTMYIRNNGQLEGQPSFTAHLLALRAPRLPGAAERADRGGQEEDVRRPRRPDPRARGRLRLPCHGGQYDTEGNRRSGPPVRALDRAEFSIRNGNLFIGTFYSVAHVEGTGAPRGSRSTAAPFPACTSTAPRPGSTRSRCRNSGHQVRTRGAQLESAALYPLDWLEERSGLVGGMKYFLFRKVPRDSGWFHTLGSATLTAFLVQAITGVVLAMYYKPDPDKAYQSIQFITNDLTLGWLVRGMHRWGASVFIILMFFHMARVFLFGAYKYPRELNWIIGVLLLAMGMLEGFTGYLLPWDQTAYWATVVGINLNGTAPVVGPFLAQFLSGGAEIGSDTLSKFYSLHMLVIPGAIFGLIGLHLYLVMRLGVTLAAVVG